MLIQVVDRRRNMTTMYIECGNMSVIHIFIFIPVYRCMYEFSLFLIPPRRERPREMGEKRGNEKGSENGHEERREKKGSLTPGRALANFKGRNRERGLQDSHLYLNLPRTTWRSVTSGLSLSWLLQSASNSLHIIGRLDGRQT